MDVGERQDWLVGVTYLVVGVWRRTRGPSAGPPQNQPCLLQRRHHRCGTVFYKDLLAEASLTSLGTRQQNSACLVGFRVPCLD